MDRKYGWIPDRPDPRDHYASLTREERLATLPSTVSHRAAMPPVYDQLELGSCTANSLGAAVQYQQIVQNEIEGQQIPSRLFIYYCERMVEGNINSDAGAALRDGIKCVNTYGAPPETDWPYDITKFKTKPPAKAWTDGLKYRALTYARPIRTSYYLRNVLAVGRPFVFGFTVYESFESTAVARNGIVPMPQPGEQILGGHAVLAIGYKWINSHLYFEVRNSWGDAWGDGGYFWMPLAYLLDTSLSDDFWDIKLVS